MADSPVKKDFFDKLSSFSGVIVAVAGLVATLFYNSNQNELQKMKTDSDILKAKVQILEIGMKYVASDKPEERDVGYFVIGQAGYRELALNIIKSHKDTAGRNLAESIVADSSEEFHTIAKATLKILNSKSKLDSLIAKGKRFDNKRLEDPEVEQWAGECKILLNDLNASYRMEYDSIKKSFSNNVPAKNNLDFFMEKLRMEKLKLSH